MSDPRSLTGKAAKKLLEAMDARSFNPDVFAYIISNGTPEDKRVMTEIVIAWIKAMTDQYRRTGEFTKETVTAARLYDTLVQFETINQGD